MDNQGHFTKFTGGETHHHQGSFSNFSNEQPSLTIHSPPTSAPTFTPHSHLALPSWLPRIVEWHHEASGKVKNCPYYMRRGVCTFWPFCKYRHPMRSATHHPVGSGDAELCENLSRYWFCRFGTECRYFHPEGVKYIFHPADEYKANGLPRRHVMAACRHGDECLNRTFCLFDHP
ncbi:hypothetical protein FNV43_RR26305 [Rhamnella rubrinervis]|uniref:C3H1-type domain-containing protein n=1 Tax=Rhamnella rubrinervis TaxID=2594499 RepID=A0A8K0GMD4_9ROSA|nr:hypothetical protein FNV43_RR26305 [Rhamnella rubrinervis]